ncbi:hypothetical protein Tco_0437817 [Tanacetum coccineum]
MNVFMRIGFNSTIKLVSFDESQVDTFNSELVCGFRNGDAEPGVGATTRSAAYMGSSSIRWAFVSSFEWNSPVSSTNSSIQGVCRSIGIDILVCLGLTLVKRIQFHLRHYGCPGFVTCMGIHFVGYTQGCDTFVDFRADLVEGSSKRAGEELE